jgi:hypothetical protein
VTQQPVLVNVPENKPSVLAPGDNYNNLLNVR